MATMVRVRYVTIKGAGGYTNPMPLDEVPEWLDNQRTTQMDAAMIISLDVQRSLREEMERQGSWV